MHGRAWFYNGPLVNVCMAGISVLYCFCICLVVVCLFVGDAPISFVLTLYILYGLTTKINSTSSQTKFVCGLNIIRMTILHEYNTHKIQHTD